ncbi:unnamed protein product [Prorocentrum cordatum]|uniref:Uncharacterized protein n=1 Tax=Prorocentrum cordatum TaxID=2364126 RepID=A0ABN9WGA1_9DINO|nr:unnamed protein product [Polarella glacialis]
MPTRKAPWRCTRCSCVCGPSPTLAALPSSPGRRCSPTRRGSARAATSRSATTPTGGSWTRSIRGAAPQPGGGERGPPGRHAWVTGALRQLVASGVRVAVAGRLDGDRFRTLSSDPAFELPADLEDGLFVQIPDFRNDVSSTEIRRRLAK